MEQNATKAQGKRAAWARRSAEARRARRVRDARTKEAEVSTLAVGSTAVLRLDGVSVVAVRLASSWYVASLRRHLTDGDVGRLDVGEVFAA